MSRSLKAREGKTKRMNRALKPVPSRPSPVTPQPEAAEGHGRRLTAAFEALEAFPALAESRNRVLRLVRTMPGPGSDGYDVPTRAEASAMASAFGAVRDGNLDEAAGIAGPFGYVVQPFDQDPFMAVEGPAIDGPTALAAFLSLRAMNLQLFRSLIPEQLATRFMHPERGEMTVLEIVAFLAGHDWRHVGQLKTIAA